MRPGAGPTRSGVWQAAPVAPLTISWDEVARRLAPARSYWLVTTDPSGAPHAVPVWGAVAGGALHCFTSRETVKARHLARDPRVTIHLESAEHVVIVDGTFDTLGAPSDHPDVVRELDQKYPDPGDAEYLPSHDPSIDVLYRLVPLRARLWDLSEFESSQRRWHA